MRKFLLVFIFIISVFFLVVLREPPDGEPTSDEQTLTIAASFVPIVAHTQAVVGDLYHVVNLIPPNVEPHDFDPTPSDIAAFDRADIIFLHDIRFETTLAQLITDKSKIVDTSAGSPVPNSLDDEFYDPHSWLDPSHAMFQVGIIRDALIRLDPDHEDLFRSNAEQYIEKIQSLDVSYFETLQNISQKNVLLSHAFYRYPAKRYGLNIVATIEDESAVEPTSGHIKDVIDRINQFGIKTLLAEPNYNSKVLDVFLNDMKLKIETLDPLETSPGEVTRDTYLAILEQNRLNLVRALAL